MPSGGNNKYWTDELIESELRCIADTMGSFPSASELRRVHRNDLACIISKRGGFELWASRLGLSRKHSDSDTGWDGEKKVQELFQSNGLECERSKGVKCPFDLLVEKYLRVDVKSAKFASYSSKTQSCSGWFYRTGKVCQSDVVLLYKLDTGDFYGIPWWDANISNITICIGDKSRYQKYLNDWPLILKMIEMRTTEHMQLRSAIAKDVA